MVGSPRLVVWRSSALFLILSNLIVTTGWIFTVALSTNTVVPRYPFTPCSSPRFDDFGEKLIGEWHWYDPTAEDTSKRTESVQEVMRSCGGAVQGVREVPSAIASSSAKHQTSTDETNMEGYYLNRANDGFTYFDKDGSYSCGPVQLDSSAGTGETTWISSLSFGKARVILVKEQEQCEKLTVYRKSVLDDLAFSDGEDYIIQIIPEGVVWLEVTRCRMPSTSQPWMTQRLKWERYVNSEESKSSAQETIESTAIIHSWLLQDKSSEHLSLEAACTLESESYLWSAGGVCGQTGAVKSIMREYSSADGSLKSVAWLRGRISDGDSGVLED